MMMGYNEKLGIVRTVYAGIFRDIQQYSGIIEAHEPYSDVFRTLCNP